MTDSSAGYEWGRLSVGHGSCSYGGSVHRVGVCGGGVVVHSLRRPGLANAVAGAPSGHALWLAGKRAGLAPGRHCSVQWKLRCSEEGKALQRGPARLLLHFSLLQWRVRTHLDVWLLFAGGGKARAYSAEDSRA